MKNHKILKWISGSLEAFLAIPILGGTIIMSMAYIPLYVMFALHVVTLMITIKEKSQQRAGSIVGIVTSCIAWIPFLGWAMHLASTIVLFVQAAQKEETAA